MLFPTRVRPNKHIENDGRLMMASNGAASATQMPNIKMVERRFSHSIAPASPTTAVRQPTTRIVDAVCPVDADDLCGGIADHPIHQNEALFVPRPAGLCFIDPLLGRIRFCHSCENFFQLLFALW